MFKALTPIVRGRCTCCGYSRNIWANELPGKELPCDHAEERGCRGHLEIVFVGPRSMLPTELHHAGMHCGCPPKPSAPAPVISPLDVSQLCDMGFSEDAAMQALTVAERQGGGMEAAVEWLMSDPAGQAAASGEGACAACNSSASAGGPEAEDAACCAICTEDLEPSSAAMRCSGQHGKRHYYHAMCLNAWIQQCRRENNPPTCPECRGPLQVQQRRLREFLDDHSGKLEREDMEALRAMHDAAEPSADREGWSGVKAEKIIKGALIGAGVVAGLAIVGAAAFGAFSQSSRRSRDDDDRRPY